MAKKDTIQDKIPRRCLTCYKWKSKGELEEKEEFDILSGRCAKTGCQCPPCWCCKDWESGNGPIWDANNSVE